VEKTTEFTEFTEKKSLSLGGSRTVPTTTYRFARRGEPFSAQATEIMVKKSVFLGGLGAR